MFPKQVVSALYPRFMHVGKGCIFNLGGGGNFLQLQICCLKSDVYAQLFASIDYFCQK